VIEEPLGGAHRDHFQTSQRLKKYLIRQLRQLTKLPTDELVQSRYEKFRRMGVFLDQAAAAAETDATSESASSSVVAK